MSDSPDISVERLMAAGCPALLAEEIMAVVANAANFIFPSATYSQNHQIETDESRVRINATGGDRSVWLPPIAESNGRQYKIYRAREDATTNAITIKAHTSDGEAIQAQIVFPNGGFGIPQSYTAENNGASWDIS